MGAVTRGEEPDESGRWAVQRIVSGVLSVVARQSPPAYRARTHGPAAYRYRRTVAKARRAA